MEERRRALRLGAAALGLALSAPGWTCTPALEGVRLESSRHVLTYRAEALAVSKHFSLDVSACSKSGKPPQTLKVDAHMPEHRHGMNYSPTVKKLGPSTWRAEGLLLHMPGRWEFVFEVDSSDLLRSSFVLSSLPAFSEEEKRKILSHGPWPPKLVPDPGNRVSGKAEAIAFGEALFFEPRLSGTGSVLCATCHVPFRAFQDGRARGLGLEEVDRNTQGLLNARFWRWFGWDGGGDSLWAQSIRPLLDAREMRSSAAHVASFVRKDARFLSRYEKAFGRTPPSDDEELLADVGKALAAFQETLVSARTAFDDFRDALESGNEKEMEKYPEEAIRGMKIFVGRGNCSVCHFGPLFSNGEFADNGVPFFAARGRVDTGRHGGIRRLKENRFNLLGRFNDDATRANAVGTRHVEAQHRNFGEFRVPSLREAAHTAPYMHNGTLATLSDVVRFYSELNEERLHSDGERILRPLKLSSGEAEDLVAFLRSLSAPPDSRRP
jgi:cytochrome c peroxidase